MNPDQPYCFLICAFDDTPEALQVRRDGIDRATERFGFPTYRIDEIPKTEAVIEATRDHIASADFVVADLTGGRPNCYYEVGYAHALGRPVVHLINANETPQFNVAGLQFLRYNSPAQLRELLERHILTHVLTAQGPADEEDQNKGRFGRRAFVDPYIVTGRVWEAEAEDGEDPDDSVLSFIVDVRVRSVDPKRPLKGKVTFHLHESFEDSPLTTTARDGIAEFPYWVYSYGTFTLGVELHQSGVRLELDLSRLPGAGAEFRNR